MDDKQAGGFLIPEIAYVDEARAGWFFLFVRCFGWRVVLFGAWIKSLGYSQREIHPHESLMQAMSNMRAIKEFKEKHGR